MVLENEKKTLLIVEDNEINREILSEILSPQYKLLEAGNGQEALDLLNTCKDHVSLILLDVMMPVMDGYTFLKHVKGDPSLAIIPVIVMTESVSEENEVSMLSHGATDFTPKPYRPKVILHRVASIIKLRETSAMVNQLQYDSLTGLYSKDFLYRKIRVLLNENPDKEYAIICSNIENFKLYNDTFGWEAGDKLLQEFSSKIKLMVGEGGICGRYSADRFLCFMECSKERLDRQSFFGNADFNHSKSVNNISLKWGIYEINDRSISVQQMCDRALLAADSIKGQYNQPFAVYDDDLRKKLLREKAITDTMEAALNDGQFVVYFQPKYSLKENRMVGAEALVRWQHPEWQLVAPGEFISLFEKNGFISHLDAYVWDRVCMKIREWKDAGYPSPPISVNVSRAHFYQSNLADTLLAIVKRYHLEPSCIHLEVTESAYMENPVHILNTVVQLRELGFIIEMDDFGSGYASLNLFSQMKLDILKLDMQFVQNELAKPVDQSILNDIINMAHRLHLSVVAEGVETREQLDRLRMAGCDYVQGFFFAKPMSAEKYEEFLKVQKNHEYETEAIIFEDSIIRQNVLVVDEDAGYRKKICRLLAGQYTVLEASGPDDALRCLRSCGSHGAAVVILSMSLRNNGSSQILKMMRQHPDFWRIPVMATIPNGEVTEQFPQISEADDFLCKCHPLADLGRRIGRLMDLTVSHQRVDALQNEASRDYLTGLLNRRGLQAAMNSLRKENLPLAICLFDLDNLKKLNDTCGHDAGDRMIQSFADLLRRQTRKNDIRCRYGGDEFLLILKSIDHVEEAVHKGMEICRDFYRQYGSEPVPSACSCGIAMCTESSMISSTLIKQADQALYRAKRENRGGCCLWSESDS